MFGGEEKATVLSSSDGGGGLKSFSLYSPLKVAIFNPDAKVMIPALPEGD